MTQDSGPRIHKTSDWIQTIFDRSASFEKRCERVFQYQANHNPVYRKFISAFGYTSSSLISPDELPLLPVRAFKETRLLCNGLKPECTFRSSGTGTMERSSHFVADIQLYLEAIKREFYDHFPLNRFSIFCYLPGYAENPESSLIRMAKELVKSDPSGLSSFLPLGEPLTLERFKPVIQQGRQILLFGAAFGFIDLIGMGSDRLPEGSAVLETGGMKTHRREISRSELRSALAEGFGIPQTDIHSEYGMCELLSQCYAIGGEWFTSPEWTRVTVRDPENPSRLCEPGEEGKIGIIDLANVFSCPFLLTDDRGVIDETGKFRVLGRWHATDLRGCNFLIDQA